MNFISLRGGGKVHIVRTVTSHQRVVMECGKESGQFASMFERPSVGHLDLCYWCRTTFDADQRQRRAHLAQQQSTRLVIGRSGGATPTGELLDEVSPQ